MKHNRKVVIACSGLGHVCRGNEAWAHTVAEAIHNDGYPVRLVGGGPLPNFSCDYTRIRNIPRDWFGWRPFISWPKRYAWEQQSFAWALQNHLRQKPASLIHVADPVLAYRLKLSSPSAGYELIYKDGLLLGPLWWRQFKWVQVLAPQYRDEAISMGVAVDRCHVIPHMVNTQKFVQPDNKARIKFEVLGTNLPENALIVLGVGDFSAGSNKRLDWIINEVDRTDLGNNVHLVLAGQASFADIQRVTKLCQKLGDRVHLRPNTPPDSMRMLYQVADVMVHAALREPFGIVLLESMACGVPVIGHSGHSVTGWIIGNGGCTVDMTVPGELSATLRTWNDNPKLRFDFGMAARERVLEHFSPAIITPLYRQFYSVVNSG